MSLFVCRLRNEPLQLKKHSFHNTIQHNTNAIQFVKLKVTTVCFVCLLIGSQSIGRQTLICAPQTSQIAKSRELKEKEKDKAMGESQSSNLARRSI